MFLLAPTLLGGCSAPDVTADFEARKAAALGPAHTPGDSWTQEGVVRLSPPLVTALLADSIQGELDGLGGFEVSIGSAEPTVTLDAIELSDGACAGCIGVEAELSGQVVLKLGKAKTKVPWEGTLSADLGFDTKGAGDGRHITMGLESIRKLKVSTGDAKVDLSGALKTWGEQLFSRVDDIDLGAYGGEELHLQDIRIEPEGAGLRVAFVTDVPAPGELTRIGSGPKEGFQVILHEDSLLSYARREAFAAGSLDYDIWAVPTKLEVNGHSFEMGLRVWRIEGTGWWRDYTVVGDITAEGGMLGLAATSIEEGKKSEGAESVDPLAFLAEAAVVPLMMDAAQAAAPTRSRITAGTIGMNSSIEDAYGAGDALVLVGAATVGPAEKASGGLLKR